METQPHLLLQTAGACFPARPAETPPQVDRTRGSGPSLDSQPPAPGDHVSGGVGAVAALTASKKAYRASLVAQWLRICLLMQGTRVRALVWEDPTCHGAAGPVSHNC